MSVSQDSYLKDLNQYGKTMEHMEILSNGKIMELLEPARNGDKGARIQIMGSVLRMVPNIARQFSNSGLEAQDIICEGIDAIYDVIEKFDPKYNAKFSTYAATSIYNRMYSYAAKNMRGYVIPRELYTWHRKYQYIKKHLIEVTREELKKQTNLSDKNFKDVELLEKWDVYYLDDKYEYMNEMGLYSKDYEELLKVCGNNFEENAINSIKNNEIQSIIDEKLDDIEKEIIYMRSGYYGKEYTYREIAEKLGMTKQAIENRLHRQQGGILQKLGKALYKNDMQVYLDNPEKGVEHIIKGYSK